MKTLTYALLFSLLILNMNALRIPDRTRVLLLQVKIAANSEQEQGRTKKASTAMKDLSVCCLSCTTLPGITVVIIGSQNWW